MIYLEILMWLFIWMITMAIIEYSIHRWTMHRNRSWLPKWIFQDHAIEHHHMERNDINIDLPLYFHILVGSPLIIASYFISLISLLTLLAVFMYHSYTWTKLHRGIHELEENWLMKTSYFKKAKHHHELHHERPGKNFGVVFLWTDLLFRTKLK